MILLVNCFRALKCKAWRINPLFWVIKSKAGVGISERIGKEFDSPLAAII